MILSLVETLFLNFAVGPIIEQQGVDLDMGGEKQRRLSSCVRKPLHQQIINNSRAKPTVHASIAHILSTTSTDVADQVHLISPWEKNSRASVWRDSSPNCRPLFRA